MARNQNRKQRTQPSLPTEEETTSVRGRLRTLPGIAPLAGSDVLEGIGSNGRVVRAMHDVLHTPDDEKVATRLGPEQEASVKFQSDRALGDAGAEFAEDFGRDFLTAAITGEDIGEIQNAASADASELGEPFLYVTDELEDLTEYAEPADDETSPSR
jgi:hypothetical protein